MIALTTVAGGMALGILIALEGMATRVNQVSYSVLQEISCLQNRLPETLNGAKSQVTLRRARPN
jgi:hypothetical protein